ncbi:hypothetical protein [Deinococcus sp. Leaf326]|uniref:hypothetical protein n=1 Tax=Deinococcus sp. Leaf326 TaxID=1736338 RepID=UPI0009E73DC8|nr:hypothetical protein [Deinococcus sp. Leaf326]
MPKVYAQATHIQTDIPTRLLGPFDTDEEAWDAVAEAEGHKLTWERTKRGHMASTPTIRWITQTYRYPLKADTCPGD